MRVCLWAALAAGWVTLAGTAARGQTTGTDSEDEDEEAEEEPEAEAPADLSSLAARVNALEARLAQVEELRRNSGPTLRLGGYADIGLFLVEGDGSGVRRDIAYATFPQYRNFGWVFYGDLLATQINSRGDVADLGQLPGVDRFDSVHAGGHLSFIVNEVNLTLDAGLGENALFHASLNFTPRSGHDFALGDVFDVDVVLLEWLPTSDRKHSIFIGKIDSVLGIEYKQRKASQRFGIVPTLISRYTTGTALGLKGRSKLFDDHLILALAVTNGSFGTEQFHFYREIDANNAKTVSARAAVRLPFSFGTLEVGGSGQVGTQDGAADGSGLLWFVGADLQVLLDYFELHAEWLKGKSPGDELSRAYALDLKTGGYVEVIARIGPTLGLLARGELRDALVSLTTERIYVTKSWRAVLGIHLTISPQVVLKLEGVYNGEYGPVPSIPNSLVTSSLVLMY